MSADVVWCGCGDGIPVEELKCATCRMVDEANNERPPTVKEQAAVMALADDGYYQEAFEAEVALLARIPRSKPRTRAIIAESAMWLARKAAER